MDETKVVHGDQILTIHCHNIVGAQRGAPTLTQSKKVIFGSEEFYNNIIQFIAKLEFFGTRLHPGN